MLSNRNRAMLLPAAMLAAMFSMVAATLIISMMNQSHDFIRNSEGGRQKQLQAQAEVNRLLDGLATGDSIEELVEEPQLVSQGNTTTRVWIEREPENEEILHLHAEVWQTDKGPPGRHASRVVHISPPRDQVQVVQTRDGTGQHQLSFRTGSEVNWLPIAATFTPESGRSKYYESMAADDVGGIFVAEVDERFFHNDDRNYAFRRFDTATGTWTNLPLPPGEGMRSLGYSDGKVVALTRSNPPAGPYNPEWVTLSEGGTTPWERFNQVSTYDIETETWTTLPPPPNKVYERSGQLRDIPQSELFSYEIDVDTAGDVYFRAQALGADGEFDDQTTLHRWNGQEWSTLPPVPASLLPPRPPQRFRSRNSRVNKQLTTTGDGSVAMVWTASPSLPSGWGANQGTELVEYQMEYGTITAESRLLEFDGNNWTTSELPSLEVLYGADYWGVDPFSGQDQTPEDLSAPVSWISYINSDQEGEVFINNDIQIASLEEGAYERMPLPGENRPVNSAAGSQPGEGQPRFETVVSF